MKANELLDEFYSLPSIYNKEGINILKNDNKIIKLFYDGENIQTLKNKKAKLEYLLKNPLYNFSRCIELDFSDPKFSYYVADFADGDQVSKLKGYKHSLTEKISVLYKTFEAIEEAHEKGILVNDIHGRNFFYDSKRDLVKGIDIDNFQVGNHLADELPDFMVRFADDVKLLNFQTDLIAFGLMILDILCPKDIDLDDLSAYELVEFVDMLVIKESVKDEFYRLFTSGSADMENILSGLSNETGKVLSYRQERVNANSSYRR